MSLAGASFFGDDIGNRFCQLEIVYSQCESRARRLSAENVSGAVAGYTTHPASMDVVLFSRITGREEKIIQQLQ